MSQHFTSKVLPRVAALGAMLALMACAAPIDRPATMMAGPERGRDAALAVGTFDAAAPRQVQIIAVTAQTIARHGGAPSGNGGGYDYRVGVGDVVQIHAVDAPELTLSSGYRVEGDGAIQVPFLGRVPVDGRGTAQIRSDLAARLQQYIARPQVDVRVTEFNARHITVTGSVARPRRQSLTDQPLTVIDAIHEAGGFAEEPQRAQVVLIRDGIERAVDLTGFLTRGTPTPVLRDGDVVRVGAARGLFTAPASAQAPSQAQVHDGTRARAIDLSRGSVTLAQVATGLSPNPGAAVFVLRPGTATIQAFTLTAPEAFSPALGGRFHLRPGDMVTIDPRPSSDAMQQVAQLTPALRALDRQ